jgi:hypothetical protein
VSDAFPQVVERLVRQLRVLPRPTRTVGCFARAPGVQAGRQSLGAHPRIGGKLIGGEGGRVPDLRGGSLQSSQRRAVVGGLDLQRLGGAVDPGAKDLGVDPGECLLGGARAVQQVQPALRLPAQGEASPRPRS